jgi:hypothetical protein
MPDQENAIDEQPLADESAPAAGKSSILAKIKTVAVVLLLIVAECVVAHFYLPSEADTAAMANATFGADSGNELLEEEAEDEELANQIEVDLGEFSVTSFQPISNTTLRIDFHLFGTVQTDDQDEFLTLMDGNMHRFREQVIVTVRGADITDLTDAGLGLVKRKILEKTNKIIGKPLLRTVIFSEFSFIEQ